METVQKTDSFVMNTYARKGISFEKGSGCRLWDENGKEYLDFLAGIAVCGLGHCHPDVTRALSAQAETLVHVSNLFYTRPASDLAQRLCENSFADKVFFSNSGAEANEAAIKLARRYFQKKGETNRNRIITMKQSFHGRTMATLSATGQEKIKQGFEPLLPGFVHVPFNDMDAPRKEMDDDVCAVMLEPVQGEGGVIPAAPGYLEAVRKLCDEKRAPLIFDEVQTGMGRCGRLFAHQAYNVAPDIMTLAKALGNGLPIGAMLASEKAAQGFDKGSHASTFGGTPLVAAAALAVLDIVADESFLARVRKTGDYLKEKLYALQKQSNAVKEIRGLGLLVGMEIEADADEIVEKCLKKGFILNAIQGKIIRFAPPLIVTKEEIDQLADVLSDLLDR
ncbi:MAG: acetylornithine transaminase [Desulfarculaceae bacterium]|nr:acetylornithine transaminase [Desulfarculaceae bacterium]